MHKRGVAHLSWAVRRAAVNTLSAWFGARDWDRDSHITNPLAVLGSLFETWSPVLSVLLRAVCCGTQVLLSYRASESAWINGCSSSIIWYEKKACRSVFYCDLTHLSQSCWSSIKCDSSHTVIFLVSYHYWSPWNPFIPYNSFLVKDLSVKLCLELEVLLFLFKVFFFFSLNMVGRIWKSEYV